MKAHAQALLKWYEEMGVDEAVAEQPVNRLQRPAPVRVHAEAQPKERTMANVTSVSSQAPVSFSQAVAEARALADRAATREELEKSVRGFEGCALKKTAINTVFCDGNPEAEIVVIGEAPGANEDQQGIPFCGASGKLMDKIFASIGLSREKNLYITNSLFWRPPGNRKPTPEELNICRPFVEKHIALKKPKLLVLVGSTAIASVLEISQGITRLRGSLHQYTNRYLEKEIPVMLTFHPSYLLRQPSQKQLVWQDMLKLKHFLAEHGVRV